jgi:hypothetical protein
MWHTDLFLGNGHEANDRTMSVARWQILDMQEQTAAARERFGNRISAAMNRHNSGGIIERWCVFYSVRDVI